MELEASQANSENDRIYTEFDIREARTNALIRQQQASYEQLIQVRIERDVVKVSVQMQEKGIADLTDQNEIQTGYKQQIAILCLFYFLISISITHSELADMSAKVQEIREEIRYLKRAVAEKNHIIRQNEHLRQELRPISANSRQLQSKVTRLCHKLVNEGLEISKKERAFQSTQIAQRIDGISAALVYDTTPVPSPQHSPVPSTNNSLCDSPTASGHNAKGRASRGGERGGGRSHPHHHPHHHPHPSHPHQQVPLSRQHSANSAVSEYSTGNNSLRSDVRPSGAEGFSSALLPPAMSSYDELLTPLQLDPEAIWKVPTDSCGGSPSRHYIMAPASRNYTTDRNIIRQRLRELQHMQKADINSSSSLVDQQIKYESTAKISFSMLNC